MKNCVNCPNSFEITESDRAFYQKMAVPEPTHCPSCRLQRRLSFRNERNLHRDQGDLCSKPMLSMFRPDSPFPVYCVECWWSDKWNPADYGRDFDFSRPFFEQFAEFTAAVPKACSLQLSNENSEYNALLAYSKNTYMCPGSYFMEDSYYCRKSQYTKDSVNSHLLDRCELVADSTNCKGCYGSHHLVNCRNCSSSAYLADCNSCQDCFMCTGLKNKQYHFKNQAYSKEDYERIVAEYKQKDPRAVMQEFLAFNAQQVKRYQNQLNCENASGDYLCNSSNALECYDCFDVQDSKYLVECVNVKDCMDMSFHDKDVQLCYEMCTGGESNYLSKFNYCGCACPHSEYLQSCFYLSDSFACEGFHGRAQHYIFNKQYSPEDYAALRARIIEHMKSTGEYGEFFPIWLSPFPYNETVAQDYFPLNKEEALAKGYKWADKADAQQAASEALSCEECGKAYRIIPQEKALCDKIGVATSTLCLSCRDQVLIGLKNPRQLWQRPCDRCHTSIQSTYAPERPERVYCEPCYLNDAY